MLLDLRGTSCTWDREKIPPSFFPAVEKRLYYPTSPLEALSLLSNSQGLIPSSDFGVLHIDHLTHASCKRSRNFWDTLDSGSSIVAEGSNTALLACDMDNYPQNLDTFPCSPERSPGLQRPPHLHPPDELLQRPFMESDVVAAESDAYDARYKAKMFYSRGAVSTNSSVVHPSRMPQWGQELLMLYREPPPWSQAQLPPIVKPASRPRGPEDLVSVDRANERSKKGVQEMRDMLSDRHRLVKKGTDRSCDGVKASTKISSPRNPFAIRFGELSTPVHERANEETSTPQHPDKVTKSTMVTPKSLQSLRPISSIPIPIPPDSSLPVPENKGQGPRPMPCGLRHRRDSNRNCRPVSLQTDGFRDQRMDMSLACGIGRSGPDRAEPAAARKRSRTAALLAEACGSKAA